MTSQYLVASYQLVVPSCNLALANDYLVLTSYYWVVICCRLVATVLFEHRSQEDRCHGS